MLAEGVLVEDATTQSKAQLLRLDADGAWEALSFDGETMALSKSSINPFTIEMLPESIDLVVGPKSDREIVLGTIMDELERKGYCASLRLLPKSEVAQIQEVTKKLEYSRVSADFEPYYLGRESREKTCLMSFNEDDLPDDIIQSSLLSLDAYMTDICDSLAFECLERLGISFTERTNLLVRRTFKDDEEEDAFPAPEEPSVEDQVKFIGLMKRKRLCIMQFLGPEVGTLSLIPKAGGDEIDIVAAPGTMVIFVTEFFHYSHCCESGEALTLQCWFLSKAPELFVHDIGGDMEVLAGITLPGAPPPSAEPVAVTGTGAMFASDSGNLTKLWLAVNKSGADGVIEFPTTRFDTNQYILHDSIQEAQASGKIYTKHQGFVDGIEFFDCTFFNIAPNEARSMDPNQRKCMETAYMALEDAGFSMRHLKSKAQNIGAFVGYSGVEWNFLPHPLDSAGCGSADAIISNRINFVLNLKGTSLSVNTACSASLVAIHIGKVQLLYKDFDPLVASVAGGVQLAYTPTAFISCCSGGMLSYLGRCFTFDKTADGYLRGEGCGFVCLQLQSMEQSYCLCAGSQTNQDGRSASITAPNGPSQEKCIRAALREAERQPEEVDCFECHGTGTALGDPIEVGAFRRIYAAAPRAIPLAVCTSKTYFGHSEGAAGITGFLKCCLQVANCEFSPNLHLREVNANIDLNGFPAQFLSEGIVGWSDSSYCGVSSFGFGGTNGHAIAYSRNKNLSRSVGKNPDYRKLVVNKIEAAEPTSINKPSLDPEEWESSGMPLTSTGKPRLFQVEFNNDGPPIWREVVPEPPATSGKIFHLSGTFNNWGLLAMKEDPAIPGLFCADVTIGDDECELFRIVVDRDADLIIFPEEPMCCTKTSAIRGPETPAGEDVRNCTWCISGSTGAKFNIQFFRTASTKTITWVRSPDV